MIAFEYPLTFCDIQQLVFVQLSSFIAIEIVAVSMSSCRVGVARCDFLISYSADGKSPFAILFVGYKVFTYLHILVF